MYETILSSEAISLRGAIGGMMRLGVDKTDPERVAETKRRFAFINLRDRIVALKDEIVLTDDERQELLALLGGAK